MNQSESNRLCAAKLAELQLQSVQLSVLNRMLLKLRERFDDEERLKKSADRAALNHANRPYLMRESTQDELNEEVRTIVDSVSRTVPTCLHCFGPVKWRDLDEDEVLGVCK